MKKINNLGITLVELMISIAIFSVIMASLFGVLSIATKNFTRNNTEINVQNEAQSLMNHLDDAISSAKYGVELNGDYVFVFYEKSYSVLWRDASTRELYIVSYPPESETTTISNYVAAGSTAKSPTGIREAKKIFATADFANRLLSLSITDANRAQYLLAENLDSFSIVPNNPYGYVSVYLTVREDQQSNSYAASKNINIRNLSSAVATNKGEKGEGGETTPAASTTAATTPTSSVAGGGGGGGTTPTSSSESSTTTAAETTPTPTTAKPKYTVTYVASGASNVPGDYEFTSGESFNLSSKTPVLDGKSFLGWSTVAGSSTPTFNVGANVTFLADTTLYAVWGDVTFTIKYNGQSKVSDQTATKKYGENIVIESATPYNSEQKFMGWATRSGGPVVYSAGDTYDKNEALTLFAVVVDKTYTLTYNANGGVNAPASVSVKKNENVDISVNHPTRDGYVFLGWSKSATSSTISYSGVANEQLQITDDITLYAVWRVDEPKEVIFYKGGAVERKESLVIDKEYTAPSTITMIKMTYVSSDKYSSRVDFSFYKSEWNGYKVYQNSPAAQGLGKHEITKNVESGDNPTLFKIPAATNGEVIKVEVYY